MLKLYRKAFTLVELIVVIVILAILATIAFISFNSYSSSSRDSLRLADITNIAKGLTLQYTVGGYYIIPDNSVNLYSGSTIIGYQGKAGSNTLNTIKISSNGGKDPVDNTYYTYNTNINKNRYQVTGYLENKGTIINRTSYINDNRNLDKITINNNSVILNLFQNLLNNDYTNLIPHLTSPKIGEELIVNKTYATTYTNRFPYLKGDSIGVILNYTGTTSNPIYTPIEDITTSTGIDISSGTLTSGKVVISNNTDSSTGVSIVSMSGYVTITNSGTITPTIGTTISNPGLSCKDIKTQNSSATNGTYWVKPDTNPAFQVYCEMITDGGGWTLVASVLGSGAFPAMNGNLLDTYSYGTYSSTGYGLDNFYKSYSNFSYTNFLFISGDKSKWCEVLASEARMSNGSDTTLTVKVINSYGTAVTAGSYTNTLNRGNAEDPWFGCEGNHTANANNGMLWGEYGTHVSPHDDFKNAHGGIGLFIK